MIYYRLCVVVAMIGLVGLWLAPVAAAPSAAAVTPSAAAAVTPSAAAAVTPSAAAATPPAEVATPSPVVGAAPIAATTPSATVVTVATPATPGAPVAPAAYAAATGHHLVGAFLVAWRARGGLATLGYPLSEASRDETGQWVQVTERALLTLPAEAAPHLVGNAGLVVFESLGRDLIAERLAEPAFQPVPEPVDSAARWFAATGHTLANGFLAHWQANHGLITLGLPLSEEFVDDGHIVQWFERGRLEYNLTTASIDRLAIGRLAPRASRWVMPSVPSWPHARPLERLPLLPSPERLAPWQQDAFGLGPRVIEVLLPIGPDRPLPRGLPAVELRPVRERAPLTGAALSHPLLLDDLAEMVVAAQARHLSLNVLSGYRSVAYQKAIVERELRQLRQQGVDEASAQRQVGRYLARPGESEHHLGTAIDFNRLDEALGSGPIGRFLAEEGWRYGFLVSYPAGAEERTGYIYEPWHLRWVGRPLAAAIHADGYLAGGRWEPTQATLLEYLEAASLLTPPSRPHSTAVTP